MFIRFNFWVSFLKTVGCDGAVDSRAQKDRCGVCNGDGSSCSGGGNQGNKPTPGPKPGTTPSPTAKPTTEPAPTPSTKPPAPSGGLVKFSYNEIPGYGMKMKVLSSDAKKPHYKANNDLRAIFNRVS